MHAIYPDAAASKSLNSTIVKKSWKTVLLDEENDFPTEDNDTANLKRKIIEDLRKWNSPVNMEEKAIQQ